MSHDYHEGAPNYHPGQLFFDGCYECQQRAKSPERMFDHLDMREAWQRAWKLGQGLLDDPSETELPVLRCIYAMQVAFERFGVPMGCFPADLIVVKQRESLLDEPRLAGGL